jgi:hypothetical protein
VEGTANKGVHTQRKIHVALRLMLLGLPIVLIIILAFFLFYTRLYSLLDAEKQTQYESRARQCANLITYQIASDQNRLASLAHSLSNLTIQQSLEIVEGLDNAALTLITENIPSEVMPFAVDALPSFTASHSYRPMETRHFCNSSSTRSLPSDTRVPGNMQKLPV